MLDQIAFGASPLSFVPPEHGQCICGANVVIDEFLAYISTRPVESVLED